MQENPSLELDSPVRDGVDKLCSSCVVLPFTEEDVNRFSGDSYALGTISEIPLRPQCPMCRLLSAADVNDPQHKRLKNIRNAADIVSIKWRRDRKGFECSGLGSLGMRLCFVRENDESTFGQGRRICTQQIDTELVAGWLQRCQQEHGRHCEAGGRSTQDIASTTLRLPSRLIDVRKRCIVEVESVPLYVTLSYVWGKVSTLRLLKENKLSLMKPLALDSLKNKIPLTIIDAMDLVASLGFQYLWVDALCIVQDDGQDLAREIEHMDLIYETSLFTIIAAHGTDANAGLPGVRPNSRQVDQVLEKVSPDTALVALYELDDLLRIPIYSTRGWTFQERILSRRNVVFVNGQVFFQCQLRTWSEDTWYESEPSNATPDSPYGSLLSIALSQDSPPHESFRSLVMYYSERNLSYESDALNAAAGLLRMLATRMKSEFIQGLPKVGLDAYLLFYMTGDTSALKRRPQFPSYSWAGWKDRVDWFEHSFFGFSKPFNGGEPTRWVPEHAWISWYELSPDGTASTISDPQEIVSDKSTLKSVTRTRLRKEIPSVEQDVEKIAVTIDASKLADRHQYPFLAFRTISIQLKIRRNVKPRDEDNTIFELSDKDSSFCGYVWYDESPPQKSTEYSEFILLSETNYGHKRFPILEMHSPYDTNKRWDLQLQLDQEGNHSVNNADEEFESGDEDEVDYSTARAFYDRLIDHWDFYWVMLIQWDNGIAERRGIGQIYKAAAEKSFPPGPAWKQIVLA